MLRTHRLVAGGAAALMAAAVLAACTKSKELSTQSAVDPMFQSYVALGNSLTSGFQSGGINDSTQSQAYPVLLAQQMNTRFAIPMLAKPGCPPPVDTFTDQHRVGGGTASTCALRQNTTAYINNVSVPGAAAIDPVSLTTVNSNALTTFILGGLSQVGRAAQANPTFATMFIGNNDVLAAALSGLLSPVPGISPGVTPLNTFITQYKSDVTGLKGISSIQGGVLMAVVDVTNAPLLFHSNLLFVPPVKAGFDAAAGTVTTVDASCASNVALISFQLADAIRAGTQASTVYCTPHPLAAPPNPLALQGNLFILDSAEVVAVQDTVAKYNAYIKAKADSIGWAYVDINPLLIQLKLSGDIPPFPNLLAPTAPFGVYVSLDGIHPQLPAHKLIANLLIDSVNAHYGKNIPSIP